MLDFNYNYLNGVNCGEFIDDSISVFFSAGEKWVLKINGRPYVDPDSKCKKLYEDLDLYYRGLKLPNGNYIESIKVEERNKNRKDNYYELVINIIKKSKTERAIVAQIGLGADYIGPSIYWACEAGMTSKDIGKILKTARTFGGHIIWPRWIGIPKKNGKPGYNFIKKFESINVCRGGEKGFYDRIDLTLFDLKEWYFKRKCKLQFTYDKNMIWFNQFVNFRNFINFFRLDSFVYIEENEIKIKNLCCNERENEYLRLSDLEHVSIPKDKIAYCKYASKSTDSINLRNDLLSKKYTTQL